MLSRRISTKKDLANPLDDSPPISIEELKKMLQKDADSTVCDSSYTSTDLDNTSLYEDIDSITMDSSVMESYISDESHVFTKAEDSDFDISTFAESTNIHDTTKDTRLDKRDIDYIQITKPKRKYVRPRIRIPSNYDEDKENDASMAIIPKKKKKPKSHLSRRDENVEKIVEAMNQQFKEVDEFELTVE